MNLVRVNANALPGKQNMFPYKMSSGGTKWEYLENHDVKAEDNGMRKINLHSLLRS